MKVMCIDGNWNKGPCPTIFGPKETEIVTVISGLKYGGVHYYELKEYSHPTHWETENFVPISDIDEMELVEEMKSFEISK